MKKTMKRRAFISAIAMLIVSAIVLTSSTFAWFSISKEAHVTGMNLNITTADGISISANTTKFGTSVTTDDIIPTADNAGKNLAAVAEHANNIPELLQPASTVFYIQNDGYPKFYRGSIGEDKKVQVFVEEDTDGCFVVFDLFVQLSAETDVSLKGSSITSDTEGVVESMRVGLINCGYEAFADRAKVVDKVSKSNSSAYMWVVDGNTKDATKYINDTVADGAKLNPTDTTNPVITSSSVYDSYATVIKTADADGLSFTGMAGVNRIRFYIWVEGNDPDCTNDIAGASFNFDLKLSIA